ncbi:MAG: hypothetical protein U5N85_10840 [Arcicella sp.]|nr:hypothetical protein [Arcicella sp.]
MENSKNTNEQAVEALESAMNLLGVDNTAESAGGVCVWVTSSGQRICAPISESDCSKIKGAVFVSRGKC